jgi:hypothetical protein
MYYRPQEKVIVFDSHAGSSIDYMNLWYNHPDRFNIEPQNKLLAIAYSGDKWQDEKRVIFVNLALATGKIRMLEERHDETELIWQALNELQYSKITGKTEDGNEMTNEQKWVKDVWDSFLIGLSQHKDLG